MRPTRTARDAGVQVRFSGRWDWDALKRRVVSAGTRNSLLTALMPTASTSQVLGNCESFEPFHSNVFKRTTLAGEFMVVNRYLMRELMARGLWNEATRETLLRTDGSVQGVPGVPERVQQVFRTVWEVPQRAVVDHAAARAPFIDQSQSMNLYFAQPNAQKLTSALMYAWRSGLKTGCYYLRSRPATEGIKFGLLNSGGKPPPAAPAADPPAVPGAEGAACAIGCTSCGA